MLTGSSAGIGEGIARLFAAEGARVFVHGRNAGGAEHVAREIGAHFVVSDLTVAQTVAGLVETISRTFGGIDILVNNSCGEIATSATSSSFDSSPEEWLGRGLA